MAEQRFKLPRDRRPRDRRTVSVAARRLLFDLQVTGHAIELRESPARLYIVPGCPERLAELTQFAYELRDLLREERVS